MKSLLWYLDRGPRRDPRMLFLLGWRRMHKSPLWALPGVIALILFALALTRIDAAHAGRTYAAYGGIYILSSLLWLWTVEHTRPDRWDVLGAAICLIGAGVILWGPRGV